VSSARGVPPPRLVVNRAGRSKVLSAVRTQLCGCDSFRFYVAFVNSDGVACLKQPLLNAAERGVRGCVLVSQYLNFSDPIALRQLLALPNIDARIATKGSVHAKGYFFSSTESERFVIGSSNWTASALSTNTELNVLVQALGDSALAREVSEEFDFQFDRATPLSEEFIVAYELLRESTLEASAQFDASVDPSGGPAPFEERFEPNRMQLEALAGLKKLREAGHRKGLVISATGTGKTYLSAFDVRSLDSKRLLFVVHRENIARKAMESFRRMFGTSRSYGLYTGNEVNPDADFIFSTVQTLSRPERMHAFGPDHFDYIIVDETHRAGAASYARFLDHFKPQFLLGMTATPERTDGHDIYKLFDHNIGFEIRLKRALEEDMVCPFHYYGVADITIDGESIGDHTDFNRLLAPERVERIIEKITLYGCDDGVPRGLVFCSGVDEAIALSKAFNTFGYRTLALSGRDSETKREDAIVALESDDPVVKLDYIFTVDIFNEGVDIPLVNQVVMLRSTQSPIVFVQQLGRGLRNIAGRDKYLTVIDFIGNYQNNYLIPIALYGDRSFDKDRIRRLVAGDCEGIPGTSTINFDLITKERIFESISAAKLLLKRDLRADFDALRHRIGRIPMMMDFVQQGSRDPRAFADYSKSYYNFVKEKVPDVIGMVSNVASEVLEVLTKDALNGRTGIEPVLLDILLRDGACDETGLGEAFAQRGGWSPTGDQIESAVRSINLRFLRKKVSGALVKVGEHLKLTLVDYNKGRLGRTEQFDALLKDTTLRNFLQDATDHAIHEFFAELSISDCVGGFVRYRKYSRADVFQILGFKENPVAQNVGGYLIAPDKSSCPIFVTYHKDASIADTTKYEDTFTSPECMHWFSKSNRTLKSPDVCYLREFAAPQRLPLFVQKNNDEGISFYYLGEVTPDVSSIIQDAMPTGKGGTISVVRMDLMLDAPVEASLYDYLVG
jgi:superfamily II DNA or RNA helicase/HKD family nuclease